jgi:transposase
MLPSKAPFSQRFEDAVGQACESASARQVARRFGLPEGTVRAIDLRYPERRAARRRQSAPGKKEKSMTVVSNLETAEPLWFGRAWTCGDLSVSKRQELNRLFTLTGKLFKAYILKERLDRLWSYRYEGAMLNYLRRWIGQLRWQRSEPFQKLAIMLFDHLDGILNYCRTKVRMGVVEAVNGNIKSLLRPGRGYRNLRHLLLKAPRMAAARTEFVAFKSAGGDLRNEGNLQTTR